MIGRGMLRRAGSLALMTVVASVAVLGATPARAWPDRPVTLVVPFAPGASNDIFTRAISQILSKKLGQPFIVENRPGAGGFTGSYAVKKAAPDGYMFLEAMVVSLKETMKVDLDQSTDLETVAVFATSSSAMMVPASLPAKTVAEFIEYAKKSPQPLFYGHTSKGDFAQLNAELFANLTGIKLTPISYKSAADMGTDLISGRTQVNFVSVASALGSIRGGQLRLLAYTAKNESKSAPAAPTFADIGVKGMDRSQLWWVFYAPKDTPPEIVKKMNAAINEATKDPSIVDLFDRSAVVATNFTPEESAAIVKRELDNVRDIIKTTGLKFDD